MPNQGLDGLQRQVHALTVERHQGMGCIADQADPVADAPAVGPDRQQPAERVGNELGSEVGDEGSEGRKFPGEEPLDLFHRGHRRETGREPASGMNRVTVKLPSGLANASNTNSRRGQTCSAFGSSRWAPAGSA